jgi:hypothetical protein
MRLDRRFASTDACWMGDSNNAVKVDAVAAIVASESASRRDDADGNWQHRHRWFACWRQVHHRAECVERRGLLERKEDRSPRLRLVRRGPPPLLKMLLCLLRVRLV